MTAVADAARDEATHAETRAENAYDTRGLEASYLAAGQATRVVALRRLVAFLEALDPAPRDGAPVGEGALVCVETPQGDRWRLVAPDGGGTRAEVGGVEVQVISPASPIGVALLGAYAGDVAEVELPRRHEVTVRSVH